MLQQDGIELLANWVPCLVSEAWNLEFYFSASAIRGHCPRIGKYLISHLQTAPSSGIKFKDNVLYCVCLCLCAYVCVCVRVPGPAPLPPPRCSWGCFLWCPPSWRARRGCGKLLSSGTYCGSPSGSTPSPPLVRLQTHTHAHMHAHTHTHTHTHTNIEIRTRFTFQQTRL